eukprot:SAG31_NODE_4334_length_3344_cov_4.039753_3_plen_568_part_00
MLWFLMGLLPATDSQTGSWSSGAPGSCSMPPCYSAYSLRNEGTDSEESSSAANVGQYHIFPSDDALSSNTDFHRCTAGDTVFANRTVLLGIHHGCPTAVVMRFPAVDLPQRAHIRSATIRFNATFRSPLQSLVLRIRAEDTANALPFVPSEFNHTPVTELETPWVVEPWMAREMYDSENFAPVLQQVIDRIDWSPPAAVAILLEHYRGNAAREVTVLDGWSPTLHVAWTTLSNYVPAADDALIEEIIPPFADTNVGRDVGASSLKNALLEPVRQHHRVDELDIQKTALAGLCGSFFCAGCIFISCRRAGQTRLGRSTCKKSKGADQPYVQIRQPTDAETQATPTLQTLSVQRRLPVVINSHHGAAGRLAMCNHNIDAFVCLFVFVSLCARAGLVSIGTHDVNTSPTDVGFDLLVRRSGNNNQPFAENDKVPSSDFDHESESATPGRAFRLSTPGRTPPCKNMDELHMDSELDDFFDSRPEGTQHNSIPVLARQLNGPIVIDKHDGISPLRRERLQRDAAEALCSFEEYERRNALREQSRATTNHTKARSSNAMKFAYQPSQSIDEYG